MINEGTRNQTKDFCAGKKFGSNIIAKNLAIGLSVEANELLDIFIWLSESESRQLTPLQMERVEEEVGDE